MNKLIAAAFLALALIAPALAVPKHPHRHHVTHRATTSSPTVWVNLPSGIYHYKGERWYGRTNDGQYMSERDAIKAGYRATRNGQ
jgi:hypothetical protein